MVTDCTAVSASAIMSVTNISFLKVEVHGFITYLEFSQIFTFGASSYQKFDFWQFFSIFVLLFICSDIKKTLWQNKWWLVQIIVQFSDS